jgi:hypothetical protein
MRKQDYAGIVISLWMLLIAIVVVAILKFAL